jgi:hypothetical protein
MILLRISGALMLLSLSVSLSAQVSDEAARERTRKTVRSHLRLKPDQFLSVRRDEDLEQLLSVLSGRLDGLEFVYQVSQAGDEVEGNSVVHHIFTDADPRYIVAINTTDGDVYRIHGFSDSMAEFARLMAAAKVKVLSPDQAEAVSDFYREVNPKRTAMTPVTSLIELKQVAERQCQTGSFDADEKAFDAWWNRAKRLYAGVPFGQTATRSGSGYIVEWIVLSSGTPGNCGGAPLRARLEIGADGQVGKLNFSTLGKP